MSNQNPYFNYTHSPSQGHAPHTPPGRQDDHGGHGRAPSTFRQKIAARFRNPVFATFVLLAAAAGFTAILVASYSGNDEAQPVPVIKAETAAFKEAPESPGGMDIPNSESTVYMITREGVTENGRRIENLLDDNSGQDSAEGAAAQMAAQDPASAADDTGTGEKESAKAQSRETTEEPVQTVDMSSTQSGTQKIHMETEKIPPKALISGEDTDEKPQQIHAAGSSPETLAFVRSVLDRKDGVADAASSIEPAAGAATTAGAGVSPGGYYVQLGSVTSESGAHSEWKKIEAGFSGLLEGQDYRVQRADLDRGTFYRIQAGPMSKDAATGLCEAVKAQKPGGCLVIR